MKPFYFELFSREHFTAKKSRNITKVNVWSLYLILSFSFDYIILYFRFFINEIIQGHISYQSEKSQNCEILILMKIFKLNDFK